MADDIVITGLGIVSSIGCNEERFWESLRTGRSGASAVDVIDTTNLTRTIACQVREPIDVDRPMGRAAKLAVVAARQAVSGAGLSASELSGLSMPVIVGTTMGETGFIENRLQGPDQQWLNKEHVGQILGGRPGSIAGNVQTDLGVIGQATDLYGACAAGNMAIEAARRQLLEGRHRRRQPGRDRARHRSACTGARRG